MIVRIIQSAESEISDAMDYYNRQYSGLGYEFAFEVKESLKRMLLFPKAWPVFQKKVRKCRLNRFPYAILYEVRAKEIVVFAVMHFKQNPIAWKKRLP